MTAMLVALTIASSCTSGGDDPAAADPASPTSSTAAVTDLPEPTELEALPGVETITATPFPDFMVAAFGRVWIGGVDDGVGVFDAATGARMGSVEARPCTAMDSGFGAVWSGDCGEPRSVVRIDPETMRVTGRVDVPFPDEGSVAAGEGAIWVVGDEEGCAGCLLNRIDPAKMKITDRYEIREGSFAARAAFGAVWVTVPEADVVLRIDPGTGEIEQEIATGNGPRFLAVGEGGVWIMTAGDGGVAHIDPASGAVVAAIAVDTGFLAGGDISVGEGSVWVRDIDQMVARIDPSTDRVVEWLGPPRGSGGVAAGGGNLWVSAHDALTIYRVPLGP
jgi:virginiamycin B lyase